jgi:IS605 OrfB family transposase
VTAVDLGINTTATIRVIDFNGTVIHTEFIHPGRDIDRRDKRLKSIAVRASKTMGKGGALHKGFCSNTYRKCRHINENIAQHVSKQIAEIAKRFDSDAIVFENMKGWKPRGGKKRSALRQRFHGWLKSRIQDLTLDKWAELGGKTFTVPAAYTSKLAYDGSGIVRRDPKNYALALFPNGRRYNADLNGSNNIAARGIIKLLSGNKKRSVTGKRSGTEPRRWACLCDLWDRDRSVA